MKISAPADGVTYDLAVVGTSFASTFYLLEYLKYAPASAKVIVLERGPLWPHARQIEERRNSPFDAEREYEKAGAYDKEWNFSIGFGGGSNCWWGNTPRLLPADFEMRRRFGVGEDWPFGYGEIEPYYDEAESLMNIAGSAAGWPFPKKGPYPLPAHLLNQPEELLKKAYPDKFFVMPSARASTSATLRGQCCGNGVCDLCPVDAKFTVQNGLTAPYEDARVTVALETPVKRLAVSGGAVTGVECEREGREITIAADFVALGANAIFNPALLQRSGISHPLLGRRIHEQVGLGGEVLLDDVPSFQGSTSVTGGAYHLYDDAERRKDMAGCLVETWNVGLFRTEFGKWRHVLPVRMVFEDLPLDENRVVVDDPEQTAPRIVFERHSDYAERALARARQDLEKVVAALPVEALRLNSRPEPTEAHIMGTAPMAVDPSKGVVDPSCLLHSHRNVAVLGGSAFPTGSPANPSLTIAALSLRAARATFSKEGV